MFQPERLTLARERRGMNKTKLAKALGVRPETIIAYENGTTSPSNATIEQLSSTLRFPNAFFSEELMDTIPVESVSFRALSRMTASQRNAALAAGTLCLELNAWIESKFDLPPASVPDIDRMVATPATAAIYVRSAWGLGVAPILHLLHLLESKGVRVFALVSECREVGAFSFWYKGTPFICLGTDKTTERSMFDMAHELGHLVLHRDHAAPRGRDAEREANIFAGNFLMPEPDVRAAALRNPDLVTLANAKKRWSVSVAALNYRLHELNIISDWHYRELCIEISRLGRSQEPNPLQREQSQVLTKVFTALKSEGITRTNVASSLRIELKDLNALLAGLTISAVKGDADGTGESQSRPMLRLV